MSACKALINGVSSACAYGLVLTSGNAVLILRTTSVACSVVVPLRSRTGSMIWSYTICLPCCSSLYEYLFAVVESSLICVRKPDNKVSVRTFWSTLPDASRVSTSLVRVSTPSLMKFTSFLTRCCEMAFSVFARSLLKPIAPPAPPAMKPTPIP